ncbi:MAG: orotate phosphoribosyltransferase, partial [Muribaculaceae bacterium]|nr:orotate phosphoribosyltransferase [Muribaculaceae bacterium]
MKKPERLLAEKFLQVSAIKLQPDIPFVWGSGWNSPLYNDHRRILSYPDLRNQVKVIIAKTIIEKCPEVNAIASVSTGAIPLGPLAAACLGLPFAYVRDTPKDHGLENRI